MPSTQSLTKINKANLEILGKVISVSNISIEKLNSIENFQPLTGKNPPHQTRYRLHAFTDDKLETNIIGQEFPKIEIVGTENQTRHILSQAIIDYCREGELRISATFFK